MKKGKYIGIGVAMLVVGVIVGIASIPDEVLLENPSLEMSDNPLIIPEPPTEEPIPEPPTEEPIPEPPTEEPIPEPPTEEPIPEPPTEEQEEESSDGEKIKVEIRDGVGSADR